MSKWVLVWIATISNSGYVREQHYPMPDEETCLRAVESAQIEVPEGGDAETTVSLFCAPEQHND